MITIPIGSKENLMVDVQDLLGNLVTLSGTNPRYTIEDENGVDKVVDAVATFTLLKAFCMIDTTTGGPWEPLDHKLWLRFDALPEIPLLGPFPFTLEEGP